MLISISMAVPKFQGVHYYYHYYHHHHHYYYYYYYCLSDKIYIMGGFNGQESLNSVEYYDPATNQWTMVRPMRDRRSGVGVATHRGVLYAAGE